MLSGDERSWFILFLLLLPLAAHSEEVILFETDFSSLPEHWYSEEFTFGSTGAELYWISFDHLSAVLCTGESGGWENNIFIPDGTDSVRIEISHHIAVSGGDYPELTFKISLFDHDHDERIWYEYISHQNPNINQWLEHSICPDWLEAGEWLGIRFRAYGWPGEFGSIINWKIFDVTVTAYGDQLGLSPDTWAGIKSSL
jgi:hypothetical protein